jgi:hypothetical protein
MGMANLVERVNDSPSTLVEISLLDAACASTLGHVSATSIFTGQETTGEWAIGDDPNVLVDAEWFQFALKFSSVR